MNYAENIILPGDSGERLKTPGRLAVLNPGNIWTPHVARQVQDLRAARGAVERHRRRRPHGPPLCSTTFGGVTVPPLFGGGGGGFLQGDIRIGSVSADYIGPAGGNPAPVTLPAASANVGDELWQVVHTSGTYTNPANWTQKVGGAGVLFNRFRIFSRVADGLDDDFVMPTNTLFVTASQWSLQEVLPFDTWPSSIVQGGFINTTTSVDWEVGFPPGDALTANLTGDPSNFILGAFAAQTRQQPATVTPIISDSNPDGLENITTLGAFAATGGAAIDTELTIINFQYLAVSVSYVAYEIAKVPDISFAQWTQYFKSRIT